MGKLLATLLSLTALQAAAEPLSPAAFRDRLAAEMTVATGKPVTVMDERTFRTKRADGEELTVSIDNAYAQYQTDPTQLNAIVARFARLLATAPDPAPGVEQLVVIVRPTNYVATSVAPGASLGNFLRPRAMAGDLAFFLAVDLPELIRVAGPEDLKRWKLSESDAWRRAVANIKARMGPITSIRLHDQNGPSGFGADSGLAPSLLAAPAACDEKPGAMWNEAVVLVFSRDAFLYADTRDRAMSTRFWSAARTMIDEGESMSRTVLRCRSGKWSVAR